MQMNHNARQLCISLARELGMPEHTIFVALLIAGEHASDEKHIVEYGTIATDELKEFHAKQLENSEARPT